MKKVFLRIIHILFFIQTMNAYGQENISIIKTDSFLSAKLIDVGKWHTTLLNKKNEVRVCMAYFPFPGISPTQKKQPGLQINIVNDSTDIHTISLSSQNVLNQTDLHDDERTTRDFYQGRVLDEKQNPVPFASVTIPGSKIGVMADSLGNYSIRIHKDHKQLQFSSVGYKIKTIDIQYEHQGFKSDVVLSPTDSLCSEVILQCYRTIRCRYYIYCRNPVSKCNHLSRTDTTYVITSKNQKPEEPRLNVYPNPATRGSTIKIDLNKTGTYQLQLIDNTGKTIGNEEFSVSIKKLHNYQLPHNVAAGVYYIVAIDKTAGKQYIQKLVIQ
jgi:hypothetical protein